MFRWSRRAPLRVGTFTTTALLATAGGIMAGLAGCGRELRVAPPVVDDEPALAGKKTAKGQDKGSSTSPSGAPAPGTKFAPVLVELKLPARAQSKPVAVGFVGASAARAAAWLETRSPALAWFDAEGAWLFAGNEAWRNDRLPASNVTASPDLWNAMERTARARWADDAAAAQPALLGLSSRAVAARVGKDVVVLRLGARGLERVTFPWNDEADGIPLGAGVSEEGDGVWLATAKVLYVGSPTGGEKVFREAWALDLGVAAGGAVNVGLSGLKGNTLVAPETVTLAVLKADGSGLYGRLAKPATEPTPLGEALLFADRPTRAQLEPPTQTTPSGPPPSPAMALTFAGVSPAIGKGCVSCHGTVGSGGFRNADQEISWTGTRKARLVEVIEGNLMPPASSIQAQALTPNEKADLLRWLRSLP